MPEHPEPGETPAGVETPQLAPGGPDAIDDPRYGETPGGPVTPDPDPEANPSTADDRVPDEITEPEDTGEPSGDGASGHEPPA